MSHGSRQWIPVLAIAAVLTAACSRHEETASPPPAPTAVARVPDVAAATDEARKIFAERCATCHGASGGGDGPASAGLSPKPRNFQDPEWQKSVTDEHIEQILQYGGSAVGRSAAMPANPDLTSKPDVVAVLRAYVRKLAK